MTLSSNILNKTRIRTAFNRAANSYDHVADLQRDVGRQLCDLIPTDHSLTKILDIGSGTGFMSNRLKNIYSKSMIISCDLAENMLKKTPLSICTDAEHLAIQTNSIDLIISNLCLQWCNLNKALKECCRILISQNNNSQNNSPHPQLLFSTFGPKTLNELRQSWQQCDNHDHVNPFMSQADIEQQLKLLNYQHIKIYSQLIKQPIKNLKQLITQLKQLGVTNALPNQRKSVISKQQWRQLEQHYHHRCQSNQSNQSNNLYASYEVIYVSAAI